MKRVEAFQSTTALSTPARNCSAVAASAADLPAVVAMPDAKWGETPCAFVELKAGATATETEIVEHCRASLARFSYPRTSAFEPSVAAHPYGPPVGSVMFVKSRGSPSRAQRTSSTTTSALIE